jgi:hypothetical protein
MTTLESSQRPDLNAIMSGLKDFQRTTVDYVFQRLYLDQDCVSRFLIADEAGLGKTLVARGLIAKAIDYLWDDVERIDVVYICSNQEIARQNIDRLNITRQRQFQFASRATLLPISVQQLRGNKLNFVSLTPGTSFSMHSRTGVVWERALLFFMIRKSWDVMDSILSNVLRGDATKKNWRYYKWSFDHNSEIDLTLQEEFLKELDRHPELRTQFDDLSEMMGARKTRLTWDVRSYRNDWIGKLRKILAHSSLSALEPDIIILDEFQRFRYLLDPNNEIYLLAQELFDYADQHTDEGAKTLLLSATPYKMYTLQGEIGEDHFNDFFDTVRFLLDDDQDRITDLKNAVNTYRDGLFRLALEGDQQVFEAREKMETILRKVMVRTERLAISADRNGMLRDSPDMKCDSITSKDLNAFIHYDRIAQALDVGDQVEYWKSAAYPINLMDDYKFKRELEKEIKTESASYLSKMLKQASEHMLDWDQIQAYQEIDPGNARLRNLFSETLETENWKLLWLPPALSYYQSGSVFNDVSNHGNTKALIFSSWKLVPKVISILASYEAERRMIEFGELQEIPYNELTQRRGALLQFAYVNERYTGMPLFCLLYPCLTLAKRIDPFTLAKEAGGELPPPPDLILSQAETIVERLLNEATKDIEITESGPVDKRWYWASLAFLDRHFYSRPLDEWLSSDEDNVSWAKMLDRSADDDGESRFSEHIELFSRQFYTPETMGRQPDDLVTVLARAALASPSISALRALMRLFSADAMGITGLASAAKIGLGFRTLFNTSDVITLLNGIYPEIPYWQKALQYCFDGNLQAVLDEYVHILHESLGLVGHNADESATKMAATISTAISLRSSPLRYDDFIFEEKVAVKIVKRSIRCRYAIRFGDEKTDYKGEIQRADEVRSAFNSPFRPFILATTSIGQEGLDFHQYCHRVVHWNLPPNPVDFEQREGRIHRYKGHVIRRNLTKRYGLSDINLDTLGGDPWAKLFEKAIADRGEEVNDLVPFWVFETENGYAIERQIPIMPLSREVNFSDRLKRSVVLYRSVIGQPRQQELLSFLSSQIAPDAIEALMEKLIIDLSPPTA